jgi:nucleotide-binding universal stress UspA family protein
MKILLAADGSDFTRKAAIWLARHLALLKDKADVFVHTVHSPIPYPGAVAAAGKKAVESYQREDAQKALDAACNELKGVACKTSYSVGDVAKEIDAFVKKNGIELVVIGSHGHGALANLALGSVATKLIATLRVPVLIVR